MLVVGPRGQVLVNFLVAALKLSGELSACAKLNSAPWFFAKLSKAITLVAVPQAFLPVYFFFHRLGTHTRLVIAFWAHKISICLCFSKWVVIPGSPICTRDIWAGEVMDHLNVV